LILFASGAIAIVLAGVLLHRKLESPATADALLEKADELSWGNCWLEADPVYAQAEILFRREGRSSQALYAHVSRFIPRAESEDSSPLLLELQHDLSLPEAKDPETNLRILVAQGMIETNYDASMARKTWAQVEVLARRRHRYHLMARAMGEQGIAAFILGNYATAKKLVVRAWIAAKYLGDPAAHVRYASVYGAGMVELHRYNEAIHALDEAIDTADRSKGVAYPSIAVNSKIDALRGLHRDTEALSLADEATIRLPDAHLNVHLFQIQTSKGEVFEDMNRQADAVRQYESALAVARQIHYWRGITQTGGLLARAYEREGQFDAALASIDAAIDANAQFPQEMFFAPRNLAIKAEILERMGKVKAAHALYQRGAALVDSLLGTAPTPNVERDLLAQLREVYSGDFTLLCSKNDFAQAFEAVERARGRVEAQALEHHAILPPHEPTEQERRINDLEVQLIHSDDPGQRTRLANALYEAELQTNYPSMAEQTAMQPVSLDAFRRDLGPDELALEYVLAEPHSFVLAIAKEGVHVYELPSQATIEQNASDYRKTVKKRGKDPTLAQTLFDELLAPVAEYGDKSSIVIIPDEGLHLLPFAALVDHGAYTIRSHAFSSAPSATVLHMLRSRVYGTAEAKPRYLGVAAWTQPPEHKDWITRTLTEFKRDQLVTLPESEAEVKSIAREFAPSATVLLGSSATVARFESLPLDRYRVIHLALHGYADIESPDRSALVFAPSDKSFPDGGLLEVSDIRRLHVNASLVTLSACDTGVGPVGEAGVANLSNAFLEVGAGSVVSTLWEVEDSATMRLMTEFYRALSKREGKGQALREAQLSLAATGVAPYYWASVEIVGEAREPIL
jgi:CHAT domain-containing protein